MTDVITTTRSLGDLCERLSRADFVAVDTEFMRERTFWPRLCLVQVAGPGEAVAIDPLAADIDLAPLFAILFDAPVLKVFHAARQDIEVLHHLSGRLPAPLFDTQIAAMVCGLGDSISYEGLAAKLAKASVDKSARFTDWSHRPLTKRQLRYAIDDVRHLRTIHERLSRRLEKSGRAGWVAEEMAALSDVRLYEQYPEEAWRRVKTRTTDGRFLAVLREVAAWRESRAQDRDLPRNWVLRDEALVEIAAHRPETAEDLARTRGLGRGTAEGPLGRAILAAVARGRSIPEAECGEDAPDVPAMRGWRREIFGADALGLKQGKLALAARGRRIKILPIDTAEAAD
jgi:ribonuclease D